MVVPGSPIPIPRGIIVMWYGSPSTVPEGWALCDGTNGTPNMTGRFAYGTDEENPVGKSGGSTTHTHPFSFSTNVAYATRNADGNSWPVINTSAPVTVNYSGNTGGSSPSPLLPPYLALCFIMKN